MTDRGARRDGAQGTPVRGQPEQSRAVDRPGLRHRGAAGPGRGRRGHGLRLGLGRRQPVLEAALRGDLAALGDLPAHQARQARDRLPRHLSTQPALPRAGVGDPRRACPAAGRSSAAARATPSSACAASSRRSDSTSTGASRSSRRGSRSCARCGRTAGSRHHGEQYDYEDVSFFSGTEMGPLMPIQTPPPFWIVSNPRLVTEALRREDGADDEGRLPSDPQVRRRLDDLLPRAASGGARRTAGLPARGGRRDRRRRRAGWSCPTR